VYPERQNNWGWPIAAAVFLGGAGGGTFLISFVLGLRGNQEVARIGTIAGPLLVGLCALFLVSDLGSKFTSWRLFLFNRLSSSWMSRGTFFISAFIILGLIYSIFSFWLPWKIDAAPGIIIGVLASIFAFLVTLYTGCLFGVLRRIPLWNTPALPLLFIFSALSTGMSVLIMLNFSFGANSGGFMESALPIEITLIVLEIVVLGVYLEIIRQVKAIGAASVRLLLSPWFLASVIGIGLVIPLGLMGYTQASSHEAIPPVINSLLVLIGGFLLRYGILKAGVYPGLSQS
jgi:formate-dependent nitrite reductase membrane component NrfD